MRMKGKIMDAEDMSNAFRRLAHQILEQDGVAGLALIGIRTRGVTVAERVRACLADIDGTDVPVGIFDISLYRDDLDGAADVRFRGSEISFGLDGKTVLLCDDVLYTGRTVRAAIAQVLETGRPAAVRFLAFVDRGHRELPFRADYVGRSVPSSGREKIVVRFTENDGEDGVYIYEK